MSSFTESTVTKKRPAQRPLLSRNIINNGNFRYVTAGKIYFRRQVFWTVSFTEMRDPVYYGRIQYSPIGKYKQYGVCTPCFIS